MLTRPLLDRIVASESLVRGLGDPEASYLIEWLVDRSEELARKLNPAPLSEAIDRLCIRARSIGRFVQLWCHDQRLGAAVQLAAVERFTWPLPASSVDPCVLMEDALDWEWKVMKPQMVDSQELSIFS